MSTMRKSQRTDSRESIGGFASGDAENADGSGGKTTKRAGVIVHGSSSGSRIDASDRMRGRGSAEGRGGSGGGVLRGL